MQREYRNSRDYQDGHGHSSPEKGLFMNGDLHQICEKKGSVELSSTSVSRIISIYSVENIMSYTHYEEASKVAA